MSNKESVELTAGEVEFCEAVAGGMTKKAAYMAHIPYDTSLPERTITHYASRLSLKVHIKARIKELRERELTPLEKQFGADVYQIEKLVRVLEQGDSAAAKAAAVSAKLNILKMKIEYCSPEVKLKRLERLAALRAGAVIDEDDLVHLVKEMTR